MPQTSSLGGATNSRAANPETVMLGIGKEHRGTPLLGTHMRVLNIPKQFQAAPSQESMVSSCKPCPYQKNYLDSTCVDVFQIPDQKSCVSHHNSADANVM